MTAVEATSVTEEEQSKPLALRVGAELVGSFIICFAIYSICTLGSAIYGVNMAFIALLTGLVRRRHPDIRHDFRRPVQSGGLRCGDAVRQNPCA